MSELRLFVLYRKPQRALLALESQMHWGWLVNESFVSSCVRIDKIVFWNEFTESTNKILFNNFLYFFVRELIKSAETQFAASVVYKRLCRFAFRGRFTKMDIFLGFILNGS